MSSRKINIIGDIDEVAYKEFVEQMDALEKAPGKAINIELTSHGGTALIAVAFHDRIRRSSCPVLVRAYGIVASAAVIILAAGDTRFMSKNAWLMVHEDTVALPEEIRVAEAARSVAIGQKLEDQWNKLLEDRTATAASTWAELHQKESYLTAKDCLNYGIIDEILKEIK
jgi:ATP-dependent Clp protease protease subunit